MLVSQKEFLNLFGWDDFFQKQMNSQMDILSPNQIKNQLVPARVVSEEKNLYRIQSGSDMQNDIHWACVSGKFLFISHQRSDYPAVGDWVLIERPPSSDRALIHHVLNRKTTVYRKQIGSSSDAQILSTNVDTVFITTSLNDDLNTRRIERYLTVVRDSGAQAVILLTKSDLYEGQIDQAVLDMKHEFNGIDIHAITKNNFSEDDVFKKYLCHSKTSIFLGSSGVGKSTVVNFLIGQDQIKTQTVRESDDRGRHTTTSRSLYISRYGGLVIDTPGMRELQLSDHSEGLSDQFSDVEGLISSCRFSDCQHQTEPGCQILTALDNQSLSIDKWTGYQKLESEIRHSIRREQKNLSMKSKLNQRYKRNQFKKGGDL
jgi:ribosome biogenesis GTPase